MMESESTQRQKIMLACALEYKEGMSAPIVTAFGKGEIAQKIVELARKYNIPIQQEQVPGMLSSLEKVKIRSEIPPELYLAVARIFAFIQIRQKSKEKAK